MTVEVIYQGKSYFSKPNDEHTAEEAMEIFYDDLENFTKFKLERDDCSFVLIPKGAVQESLIIFHQ